MRISKREIYIFVFGTKKRPEKACIVFQLDYKRLPFKDISVDCFSSLLGDNLNFHAFCFLFEFSEVGSFIKSKKTVTSTREIK